MFTTDTTPPTFTNLQNQILAPGQSLAYDINATDTRGISCFSINDTTNFNINCEGLLKNITALNLGTYWYNLSVNDSFNNKKYEIMSITITCISNWTAINTSCKNGDYLETWYNGTTSCTNKTPPANISSRCDFDGNRIIGNFSSFSQSHLNLAIYIDSTRGNISKIYNQTRKIEFKDGDESIVEFRYNFDGEALDMNNILIEKQSSSGSYGYLIVKGIEVNKTIRVDKLDDNSDSVCIRNSQNAQLSSFSKNCDSSSETLLDCPGTKKSFYCSISGDKFIISGLTSSAVKEMIFTEEECGSDWECEEWGECVEGIKARFCIDLNECENNKMEETNCSVSGGCTPRWKCDKWGPEKCPTSKEQTRTCTDVNNCGISTNKPSETLICNPDSLNLFFWILVIVLIVLVLIIIFTLIYHFRKKM